ncbi:MAG: hypothetical protein JNM44_04955 [Chitinophagaceae bacterium]|nr:hypothetical protein [Chitinophagaceae bacterium]
MKQQIILASLLAMLVTWVACNEKEASNSQEAVRPKHHLNIPLNGIESMVESNTQKIIEGTDGSIVVTIGEVTRKKVSLSVKRNDEIIEEKIVEEKGNMDFEYEGITYTIEVGQLKKPLLGAGKAEIRIHQK